MIAVATMPEAPAVETDAEADLLPPVGRTVRTAERRYLTSSSPWRARDVTRSTVLFVSGAAGILGCWYGAGGETNLRAQVGWILGSLAAIAIFVFGGTAWVITGLREVRHGMRDLAIDKNAVFGLVEAAVNSASGAELSDHSLLVAAPAMTRAHRQDCLLVQGKVVHPVQGARARELGVCGVCRP